MTRQHILYKEKNILPIGPIAYWEFLWLNDPHSDLHILTEGHLLKGIDFEIKKAAILILFSIFGNETLQRNKVRIAIYLTFCL